MSENPDAYMRAHRLDVIFKVYEILSQLALHRPERPLKAVSQAVQAVEATANRDPDHLIGLVKEAFANADRIPTEQKPFSPPPPPQQQMAMGEEWDSFDAHAAPPSSPKPRQFDRTRRGSVSAESYDPAKGSSQAPLSIPKTASERERLVRVTGQNLLMRGIAPENRQPVLDAMFERKVRAGEDIIVQGDIGDNFYIVESGSFAVLVEGKGEVTTVGPGQSFGELALMYNQPRAATVRALEDAVVWGLDGATFRKLMIDIAYRRRLLHKDLLAKVPLFATLSQPELARIAEALVPITYAAGETIIAEGDYGQEFFILAQGETRVTIRGEEVNRLGPGDYFGELALLNKAPRKATVTALSPVQCLTLSRSDFIRLMGPLLPYLERNKEHYKRFQEHIAM